MYVHKFPFADMEVIAYPFGYIGVIIKLVCCSITVPKLYLARSSINL